MPIYHLTTRFTKGYIAHPYWPEMAKLIDIQKKSGLNRTKSEANRRKALEEYLKANKMNLIDYEMLEKLAARPFHLNGTGEIIIPAEKIYAFLVNATDEARSATRACPPEQIRSLIKASDWHTGKSKPDGTWERFAVVSSGTGQKLSNQRGLRRSEYIERFDATGEVEINPQFVKPEALQRLIEWGGENVGIGAARKMGWGRFTLTGFEKK